MENIVLMIVIGLMGGIMARLLMPGEKNSTGFILTIELGIVGALLAALIGHAAGWYRVDQDEGLVGAVIGVLTILFIWHWLVAHKLVRDPGDVGLAEPPPPRRL